MVADWPNSNSQWRKKILEIKSQLLEEDFHLYIWIPKTYFSDKEILQEVEKIIDKDTPNIHYVFDEVYPIDIIKFLCGYDVFLLVEDDYINRYFRYLLEQTSVQIY